MSWVARMRGVQVLGAPAGDLALAVVLAIFGFMDTVLTAQFQSLDQWRGPRLVNGIVVPAAALLLAWRRRCRQWCSPTSTSSSSAARAARAARAERPVQLPPGSASSPRSVPIRVPISSRMGRICSTVSPAGSGRSQSR